MDEVFLLLDEYISQNNKLINYIDKLQNSDKEYYRENQEILYVGIVNRTYSLWETFCKDLAYKYYNRIKPQLMEKGELVHKLKLNELPGYIVEEGIILENRISYELKKDFVTYTSKNIGFEELKRLFSRFDVNVEDLQGNQVIRKYLEDNSFYFGIEDFSRDYLKTAMKNLTDERNMVSHFSSIDEYQELKNIIAWADFCKLLARELTGIICRLLIEYIDISPKQLGKFVKFLKNKQILCIDILSGISVNFSSIIYTKRNGKIINIYKPKSFMVDEIAVNCVKENDNAGIGLCALANVKTIIDSKDEIYVFTPSA